MKNVRKSEAKRFRKTNVTPNSEINIDSNTIRVYLAIDESKPIVEIFRETKLGRDVFMKCLLNLYNLKLIEQVKIEVEYISPALIGRIKEVLIEVSGPLGELLLEEAAEGMNCEITQIPKSKIADLVYQIGNDIPGKKQSMEFKKIILKEIQTMEN